VTLIEVIDTARALINEPLESTRTFPDDTSSFFQDTTLIRFFNMTQEELMNNIVQADESYFETNTFLGISAGTARYTLPSGTVKIKRVEDVRAGLTSLPQVINPVTINRRYEHIEETVTSVVGGGGYYLQGNSIVLTKTPSFTNASAIRVHYVKKVYSMTASDNATISSIPEEYHHILVYGIVKNMLFAQQSDNTTAEVNYRSALSEMKKSIENRQVQRSRRVKIVYDDVLD